VSVQSVEDDAGPVGAVRHGAEVGERPLGRADPPFLLRQLVAEGDEEAAVALPLVRGQGQDAGEVVSLLFFLWERERERGKKRKGEG
jgi:hypothetical protein